MPAHEPFTFGHKQGLNILLAMRTAHLVIALLIVLSLHGLVLYGITRMPGQTPTPPAPPVVLGKLISLPPAPAVSASPKPLPPKPALPKPSPAKPAPKPVKQSETVPKPLPEKVLAVDTPAATDNTVAETAEPAAPEPVSTPPDSPAAEPVVTPPRIDARSRDNPPPDYPRMSRRMGHEGTVMLEVYILESGRVGKVRVKTSSGYDRLDEAAIAAVKKWRYEPARRGDEPISFWYTQAVKFVLN